MTQKDNQLFPIFLKADQLKILIVGGGNVGLEKLNAILSSAPSATVSVVAPQVKEEVKQLVAQHARCAIQQKRFEDQDLDGINIVLAATDNRSLNEQIRQAAQKKNILVNVADTPGLCDFYLGSVVQKGQLRIGISTNGRSPTLAKRLKEILDAAIPGEISELSEKLYKIRAQLKGSLAEKIRRLNALTSVLVEKE